jgi:hypothetical protein
LGAYRIPPETGLLIPSDKRDHRQLEIVPPAFNIPAEIPLGIPTCRMRFFRTASDIEAKLTTAQPGDEICIRDEFAPNTPYALVLEVRKDGFDPAVA